MINIIDLLQEFGNVFFVDEQCKHRIIHSISPTQLVALISYLEKQYTLKCKNFALAISASLIMPGGTSHSSRRKGNNMPNVVTMRMQLLTESGWLWTLSNTKEGQYQITLCKPEWITKDIYQSRPLPTWTRDTVYDAVASAWEFVAGAQHD